MKIGDAVIAHKLISRPGQTRIWMRIVGVLTDIRRPPGSCADDVFREYRVYTTDGKHQWFHEDDLLNPE